MKECMKDFIGSYATEVETAATIKSVYERNGYILDTHTAVAAHCYEKYKKETHDETKTVIASTASPYKFTRSVMEAIDKKYEGLEDFVLIDELSKLSGVKVPNAIEEILTAPVVHDRVCDMDKMQEMVEGILR
jgi:threonine synthase